MELSNSIEVMDYLIEKGIVDGEDSIIKIKPLSGGVSSDVILIRTKRGSIVLKRALPKLRVNENWNVSMERSLTEKRCLELLHQLIPDFVPKILFSDESRFLFAMEYIGDASDWKQNLLNGRTERETARNVGQLLAAIHRNTYKKDIILAPFKDKKLFYDLRISPYFLFIREKFPTHMKYLDEVVEQMMFASDVLIHGDFSPKNIMIRDGKPIILDFEVAHAGHASFDIAFLIHHLILKSVHFLPTNNSYLLLVQDFYDTYFQHVGVNREQDYREITLQMMGALILARIYGKSPVEYLTEAERQTAKRIGLALLDQSIVDMNELIHLEVFKSGGYTECESKTGIGFEGKSNS